MDITKLCFVCAKTLSVGTLRTVKKKGIQSLITKSKTYNDFKWELINTKNEISVHYRCYLDYSSRATKIPEAADSPLSGRSLRASSTDSFDFKSLCLFCQKSYTKEHGSKHIIQKESIRNKIMETAQIRSDNLAIALVSIINTVPCLVDVQARYHTKCFNNFMYVSREDTSVGISDSRIENALQLIYKYIESHEECQFSIKELQAAGNNELSDQTILKYLKLKYKEDITIITRPRKDTTICYSGTGSFPIDEFWYLHREKKKEDERIRIIKTAAELIRRQIKSVSYDSKNYPSSLNFIDNVEQDIPNYLNIFMSEVMLDKFSKKKKNVNLGMDDFTNIESSVDEHSILENQNKSDEFASYDDNCKKMELKKKYLAHSIICALRPKSFISTLHHATGLYINRKSGSKLIVNLLSNLGVCASYYDVALHEISAIKAEVTTITPPVFAQYVYDNADHNAQTFDGKNTIHIAAGIAALHPPSSLGTDKPVPKLKKLPLASEVASFGNVPLKEYNDCGTSLKSVTYEDVMKYKFGNIEPGLSPLYTTYIWGRYLKVWELPSLRGFLEKVSHKIEYRVSRILLLPIIDQDPSNPQTIYTALHFAANHAKQIEMKTCIVTFDYALWIKAKQILCNTQDEELKNVQLRLGGFHLLMSYLKAVGTIMGGSGIKELFSSVFATNSVDKMLNCTAYSRAIRAHILAATAIGELIAHTAESEENITKTKNISGIKTFDPRRAAPSAMSVQRIINEKENKLSTLLQNFRDNPPSLDSINENDDCKAMFHLFSSALETLKSRGPTALLWLQYFHMVIIAVQFIAAERNGNWHLHLLCVREMLPVFHAAGHFNYIKGAQIYVQDMQKLGNTMDSDEYLKFTDNGLFTIRRTNKPWSGVWSDMTIEQTAMRFFGTGKEGTKHGRTMTDSVVSRFILGMPYAFEILDKLEQITNCRSASSDQHVELTSSRQKKDKEDIEVFKNWLDDHGIFENRPDKLISLSTGLVGDATVDCYRALDKGLKSMAKMVNVDAESYKHSKSNCVKTLIATTPVMEVDNEKVPINTTLLFQKIAASLVDNKNLMKDAISYELSPYPMALFNDSGIMRESNKSELYKSLNCTRYAKNDFTGVKYVIDGGYLLHKVIWPKNSTFEEVFKVYESFIVKNYSSNATIVFDGYNQSAMGIKSYERYRRVSKKVGPEISFTLDMKTPGEKDLFLANYKNRSNFVTNLMFFLEGCHELYIFQALEDADVLIVQTAIEIANNSNERVVVVGTDVDLAVLIIALTPEEKKVDMLKPQILKQPASIISSQKNIMYKKFILFAHAFSGCDTVSSIFKKGKKSLLKLLQTDLTAQKHAEVFYNEESSQEEIKKAGESIMLKLYGCKLPTIGECRVDRFGDVARKSSALNLALLPPTTGATFQHSLRTFLQVQLWLGNILNPENYGWKRSETMFLPVRTEDPLAPAELLTMVHCSCTTTNCTKSCGCKKAGLSCSRACKNCRGETCLNAADIVQTNNNEDDDNSEMSEIEDVEVECEFVMKPGYLALRKNIYGVLSDTDDENDGDVSLDQSYEAPEIQLNQPSTSDNQPATKKRKRK